MSFEFQVSTLKLDHFLFGCLWSEHKAILSEIEVFGVL